MNPLNSSFVDVQGFIDFLNRHGRFNLKTVKNQISEHPLRFFTSRYLFTTGVTQSSNHLICDAQDQPIVEIDYLSTAFAQPLPHYQGDPQVLKIARNLNGRRTVATYRSDYAEKGLYFEHLNMQFPQGLKVNGFSLPRAELVLKVEAHDSGPIVRRQDTIQDLMPHIMRQALPTQLFLVPGLRNYREKH